MAVLSINDLESLAMLSSEGSSQALEVFAQVAYDFVLRIASELLKGNKLRRWIDPCDIAQNVVLKACKRINNTRNSEIILNWKAFLRKLTQRNLIDQARSLRTELRARKSLDLDLLDKRIPKFIAKTNLDFKNSHENNLEILREVENALPDAWICILQMRSEGLTWNEIAVLHSVHPQTLRVRFNQAIRKLRLTTDPTP